MSPLSKIGDPGIVSEYISSPFEYHHDSAVPYQLVLCWIRCMKSSLFLFGAHLGFVEHRAESDLE